MRLGPRGEEGPSPYPTFMTRGSVRRRSVAPRGFKSSSEREARPVQRTRAYKFATRAKWRRNGVMVGIDLLYRAAHRVGFCREDVRELRLREPGRSELLLVVRRRTRAGMPERPPSPRGRAILRPLWCLT